MHERVWSIAILMAIGVLVNGAHAAEVDMEKTLRAQNWMNRAPGAFPLVLGNGRLGFSVDPSGSQLFKGAYPHAILSLLAQDIWYHPDPPGDKLDRDLTLEQFPFRDRTIGYATKQFDSEKDLWNLLRQYPTKPCLGTPRLGLRVHGKELAQPAQLKGFQQDLDFAEPAVHTRYEFEGVTSQVRTYLHATRNVLAFTVEDHGQGEIERSFSFQLKSPSATASGEDANRASLVCPFAADSMKSDASQAMAFRPLPRDFGYAVGVCAIGASVNWKLSDNGIEGRWRSGEAPVTIYLALLPGRGKSNVMNDLGEFLSYLNHTPTDSVWREHLVWWKMFWGRSFVDFTGSNDPRANELQKRWARDLYLVAANDRGAYPPAESGLSANSWYGKFHLEMTFWHIGGLLSSNRADLVKEMLLWYPTVLDAAKRRANAQGFEGARFPKQTSYNGEDSPSPVAQLLLWHVGEIPLICDRYYRATRDQEFRARIYPVLAETAEFCRSYLTLDPADGRYHLLPPIASCAENTDPKTTRDPAYELASFAAALRIAFEYAGELGQDQDKAKGWKDTLSRLAEPPYDGQVYLTCAGLTDSYSPKYTGKGSHPGMLGLLFNGGLVPADARMSRTLDKVLASWRFDDIWGWDFGLCAATAAHLKRAEDAVNLLTSSAFANQRSASGWNTRWTPDRPPSDAMPYYPGSGGTVIALHEMMANDQGGRIHVFPGVPRTPGWTVSFTDIVVGSGARVAGKMVDGKVVFAEAIDVHGEKVPVLVD